MRAVVHSAFDSINLIVFNPRGPAVPLFIFLCDDQLQVWRIVIHIDEDWRSSAASLVLFDLKHIVFASPYVQRVGLLYNECQREYRLLTRFLGVEICRDLLSDMQGKECLEIEIR